jgi:hypothetical protein
VEFAMTVREVLIAGGAAQARHALEVEHYTYRRELKELVRRFAKAASAPRPSKQPSPPGVR